MYFAYGMMISLLLLIPGWHISTPLKVWCGAWALSWIAHALLADVYFISEEALLFVFMGNVAFAGGCVLYYLIPAPAQAHMLRDRSVSRYLSGESFRIKCCYLFLVLSFLSIAYGASQIGGGLASALKGGLFEAMRLGKSALYDGDDYAIPAGIKLATMMTSITSILAGFSLAVRGRASRKIGVSFFVLYGISIFALSAISGVRSFILTAGLFFLFAYVSAKTFLNFGRNVVSLKAMLYASSAVALFLIWTVIVQSARLQDASFQDVTGTLEHLRPWFGGYLPALSVWYESHFDAKDLSYGTYLFRGVLAPLGLVAGEGFNERISFSWIGNGQSSNAMTIFRAIWADFGPEGGVVFCFLWGWLSSFVFRNAMNKGSYWLVLLASNYCAIFFSINYWFFAYGAKLMSLAVAGLVVFASVARHRGHRLECKQHA